MRGAMAFALAIRNTMSKARQTFLTTTSLIVIGSVIFVGGSVTPLLTCFGIPWVLFVLKIQRNIINFYLTKIYINSSVGVDEEADHAALPGTPHRVIDISIFIFCLRLLFGYQLLRLLNCFFLQNLLDWWCHWLMYNPACYPWRRFFY